MLKKVERAGQRETARRLRSFSSRVFRYAVATARASVDPAQPLQGALVSPVAKHHSAITDPVAFGKLLRTIEIYSGQPVTKLALRCASPHTFISDRAKFGKRSGVRLISTKRFGQSPPNG